MDVVCSQVYFFTSTCVRNTLLIAAAQHDIGTNIKAEICVTFTYNGVQRHFFSSLQGRKGMKWSWAQEKHHNIIEGKSKHRKETRKRMFWSVLGTFPKRCPEHDWEKMHYLFWKLLQGEHIIFKIHRAWENWVLQVSLETTQYSIKVSSVRWLF